MNGRIELDRGGGGGGYVPKYDADGRELVDDGSGSLLPVSDEPFRPPDPVRFTPEQQVRIGEAYRVMAEELPVEGRDYSVRFSFPDPDGPPSLSFVAMTDIGAAFVRHLSRKFQKRS